MLTHSVTLSEGSRSFQFWELRRHRHQLFLAVKFLITTWTGIDILNSTRVNEWEL